MEVRPLRPDEYQQAGTVTAGAYSEYEPVAAGWDRWGQYLQELANVAGRSRHAVVLGAVDGGCNRVFAADGERARVVAH